MRARFERNIIRVAAAVAWWGSLAAVPASGQMAANGAEPRPGLLLNSASVFGGYAYVQTPGGLNLYDTRYRSGAGAGAAVSLGWNKHRGKTRMSMAYGSSYVRSPQDAEASAVSHFGSFSLSISLTPRLQVNFGLRTALSNLSDFLFGPRVDLPVVEPMLDMDALTAAMGSGTLSNTELAALLTGAPVLEATSRTFWYGDRALSSSLTTGLSYSLSSRLSLQFGADAGRIQHLSSRQDGSAAGAYLIPKTTMADASVGLSYKMSPRTTVSVVAATARTFSRLADEYASTATVTLGRRMGRHWSANVSSGVGQVMPVRSMIQMPERHPQYVGSAGLAYQTGGHSLFANYDRTVGDHYGLGSRSTWTVTGGWNWTRRRGVWRFGASVSAETLRGSAMATDGTGMRAWASRRLSAHTSIRVEYAALLNSGSYATYMPADLNRHMARVSFVWAPGLPLLR